MASVAKRATQGNASNASARELMAWSISSLTRKNHLKTHTVSAFTSGNEKILE